MELTPTTSRLLRQIFPEFDDLSEAQLKVIINLLELNFLSFGIGNRYSEIDPSEIQELREIISETLLLFTRTLPTFEGDMMREKLHDESVLKALLIDWLEGQ